MSKKDKKQKLESELNEIKNKYLFSLAELENTRKRMQKEKNQALSFSIENTISEFLPLIDSFENALNFANDSSEDVKNWAQGFQMILSQFKDILHNHGIVAYHSVGNQFDPHYHEAMEIVETNEHLDGSIIEEFAKGYKSETRIIRPARVKITKKPLEEGEINEDDLKLTEESQSCCKETIDIDNNENTNEDSDIEISKDNISFSKDDDIKINK